MFRRNTFFFRIQYIISALFFIYILIYFGVFTHMFELDYYRLFKYPMEGDVLKYANQVRFNQELEVQPINTYNYRFTKNCHNKCMEERAPITPKVTIIVKSAMKHFSRRAAIRQSWGHEKRFSDIVIRTVFILGVSNSHELQKHIDIESSQYGDIVQSEFEDSYFNNTIKTMMGFKWVVEYCPTSKFVLFVDDDFYVSTKNVLRFLQNPYKYPDYLEESDETLRKLSRRLKDSNLKNFTRRVELLRNINNVLANGMMTYNQKKHFHELEDFVVKGPVDDDKARRKKRALDNNDLLADTKLFSGYVFSSSPHRHRSSKWYVSLAEYPFHMWPTYVTAGSYILSREALLDMYYTSMYTKHFRFDDIYLGLVALKAKISPLHNREFYYYKASYSLPHSYRYVIASHGYQNSEEMIKVWTECRAAGHA